MVEERSTGQFNPTPRSAEQDVERHRSAVDARHAAQSDQWQVLVVARYESGERSVAILRPDGREVGEDLVVLHGRTAVDWVAGDGVVAGLLVGPGEEVRIEWSGGSITVPIKELD